MAEFICIGVPFFLGQQIEGRTEVQNIKNSGFAQKIGAHWIDLKPNFTAYADPIIATNAALAQTIAAHPDKTPIIFACDCMSALGAMKGLEQHNPAVLWYDAHGDFNTPETTPSGFLGGMPLAMLVGRGDMTHMQGVQLSPITESDVIITDARDLDPEEGVNLANSAVTHLKHVEDLFTAPLPSKPLYIHFDTDVVDNTELPGMNYPAPGGPSVKRAADTLRRIRQDATIAGILFSLWDDRHPTEGKSLKAVLELAEVITTSSIS